MDERGDSLIILRECDRQGVTMLEQRAYLLATVEHETANTFKPVREAFWNTEAWREKNLRYFPYYGRGYVQLTWKDNYAKFAEITGKDLVDNPDLAMEPSTAAFILVYGCTKGSFTGKKLGDFIRPGKVDFIGARAVVNGNDRAAMIAHLAEQWMIKLAVEEKPASLLQRMVGWFKSLF